MKVEPNRQQTEVKTAESLCPSCQKPLVDSVIADLGHRLECVPCKAISLRNGDLSNLTLTIGDLPGAPWELATQSLMLCPNCPALHLQELFYTKDFPEPLYFCQSCKGILISHESLGRVRRFRLKVETKPQTKWLDPRDPMLSLLAFPICLSLAWLADLLVLPAMLLKGLDIQFHEMGHTLASWLGGTPAIPLAVVTIPFKIPKLVTYAILAGSLSYWANKGRQEGLKAFTYFFCGVLILQFAMTFVLPDATVSMLFVLGGILGQFLLPLFLAVAFFYELPKFWNWKLFRFAALFVAIYCLEMNAHYWRDIVSGKAQMPMGSLVGGAGDSNGDINRLINEFGWTSVSLTHFFTLLGLFGRITVWSHFIFLLFQKMRSEQANTKP